MYVSAENLHIYWATEKEKDKNHRDKRINLTVTTKIFTMFPKYSVDIHGAAAVLPI